ncbi:MAG: hypothetical protein NTW29_21740 [Bacteroidetes bacterium]|nr:hypothetical protein [Bacteroidota bacterium]
MYFRPLSALLIILFAGVPATAITQPIQPGRVKNIICKADSSQSYTIYIPSSYKDDSPLPLLVLLDPVARGNVPVTMYQEIAERNHIILAGSNNSKNFDPAASGKSIPAILEDIIQYARFDGSAVWLSGFSGGSRMASSYAATDERIKGVIGCGAGFTSSMTNEGTEFYMLRREVPYAAIVGDKDMNFEEMNGVSDLLTKRNKANALFVFSGGHTWPPAAQMEMAVMWLLQMQQSSIILRAASDSLAARLKDQYEQYRESGLLYFSWLSANAAKQIPSLAKTGDSLTGIALKNKSFSRHKALFETTLEAERTFMDQFSFLFNQVISSDELSTGNDELWKQKAGAIASLRKDKDPYRRLSGERIHDICRRLCSEQYGWFMETKRFPQAYSVAFILGFIDTEGLNTDYWMARAAAGMGDKNRCINSLKLALKKSDLSKERVLKDPFIGLVLDAGAIEKLF